MTSNTLCTVLRRQVFGAYTVDSIRMDRIVNVEGIVNEGHGPSDNRITAVPFNT